MSNQAATTLLLELERVCRFLGTSEIPSQQLLTFLHVAQRGEVPMADLEALTGVGQSSVSRNVARLGSGPTPDQPGYGLLQTYEDPWYRKRKLVRLTDKGKKLIESLGGAAR